MEDACVAVKLIWKNKNDGKTRPVNEDKRWVSFAWVLCELDTLVYHKMKTKQKKREKFAALL